MVKLSDVLGNEDNVNHAQASLKRKIALRLQGVRGCLLHVAQLVVKIRMVMVSAILVMT